MPDPLSHHPSMLIVKSDSLPRLWWLFPWSVARQLHKNAVALKAYGDRADRAIDMQIRIIDEKDQDIRTLQARVRAQDAIILASVSR